MLKGDGGMNLRGETSGRRVDAVVVGASAGAVEALGVLLPALPADLAVPVIVVVHVPGNRQSLLSELFASKCSLPVREAEDKQAIAEGIWFAPAGYHLLVERNRSFALSIDELFNYSRPSIDVLFESAAEVYRDRLLAVVLTGANYDGSAGAALVHEAGGLVAVQDPATAQSAAMPTFAIERAQPDLVGSLSQLAAYISANASPDHVLENQP
jgi:two-component system, chemotaxis family, protein-glutamate methylesterase/glutaminase